MIAAFPNATAYSTYDYDGYRRTAAEGINTSDIFTNVKPPDAKSPHTVYHIADFDFRLKPGSKAVDAGLRLANINDDFTGQAPDLGAYEVGKPLPVYGPRPGTTQPFYR